MKKLFAVACTLLFGIMPFISCKKENSDPIPPVVGYWIGKIGVSQAPPSMGYAFLFRNDGSVRVYYLSNNNPDTSSVIKGEGLYSVTGNKINTTYNLINFPFQRSTTATMNNNFTYMQGTWGKDLNPVDGGQFFAQKQ
jgi:hypothetical protein